MTVSYTTSTKRGGFFRLLFKWRGSVWKSIWRKLTLFCVSYGLLSLMYREALGGEEKRIFDRLASYFDKATTRIPLTFILGFYVSLMVTRWWTQFQYLTFPDRFMMFVCTLIDKNTATPEEQQQIRRMRRALARYVNLSATLVYRSISVKVMKRFPTYDHIVKAGLMTKYELKSFQDTVAPYGDFFIPLVWSANIIGKCQKEAVIDSVQQNRLLEELTGIRTQLATIMAYDWIPVPLIYTQVATLATYGYFIFCLLGRQYTDFWSENHADLYIPVFTILEFVFYIGWLQVGEDLFNPYGEDDEDFEMNFILDRNLCNGYLIADTLHGKIGGLEEDMFWDQAMPKMPHTIASKAIKEHVFKGHLKNFKLKDKYALIASTEENSGPHSTRDIVDSWCGTRFGGYNDTDTYDTKEIQTLSCKTIAEVPHAVNDAPVKYIQLPRNSQQRNNKRDESSERSSLIHPIKAFDNETGDID